MAPPSEPGFLDDSRRDKVERYLVERALIAADDLPITLANAGAGNMNVALRVTPARGRSLIVKQGRPFVAKYPQIPAPLERTSIEAAFYQEVGRTPRAAGMMPALLHADPVNHVLVLEDVGTQGDFTPLYGGVTIPDSAVVSLLEWLEGLLEVRVAPDRRAVFANRAMRELNHEHIFQFPLRKDNGFDLDGVTPGLQAAARNLQDDRDYLGAIAALGQRYLADGDRLVHGDYFPGSWLHAGDEVRVIDPEFCFLGDREFDYGVLAAHLLMAGTARTALAIVQRTLQQQMLDVALVRRYAGVEIMRRLIGVAQLPLAIGLEAKRALLAASRRLVLDPNEGLA
jgi:5-methylthioribose kinase